MGPSPACTTGMGSVEVTRNVGIPASMGMSTVRQSHGTPESGVHDDSSPTSADLPAAARPLLR